MRAFLRSNKIIGIAMLFLLLLIQSSPTHAQSEGEALSIIQQAEDKLIDVLKLLEDAFEKNIPLIDLVQETDNARIQIKVAKSQFGLGNFSQAYQTANDAIEELDSVLLEMDQRMSQKKQNFRILYSIVGVLAAIFTILFVFVFIKKIQPWFKTKQLEEYGKLEIKYENEGKLEE